MRDETTTPRRMPGLDAVRGVAVVAVVAYHLRHLGGGFLGVDLFFVLSGFLVTGLAIDEIGRTGRLGLRAFWGRRIRRLGPALLVLVPVVVAAALLLDWPTVERRALAVDGFASLTWWANWRQLLAPGGGYWSEVPSLFRHAWSLSIEEQFYVVWPLVITALVAVTRRTRLAIGVTAGVLAAASAGWGLVLAGRLEGDDLSRIYLGSDTRAVGPLVGCLAAAWCWRRVDARASVVSARAAGAAAAVALAVLVATTTVSAPSTYRNGVIPIAACLAAVIVVGGSTLRRADPVTTWLGRRSYGIYLWSWPIQVLVEHHRPELDARTVTVVTVAATLLLAEVSHRVVEHPLQRRTGWAAPPLARRLATASAGALAVVALVAASSSSTARPAHQQVDTEEALDQALHPPPTIAPADRPDAGGATPGRPVRDRVMVVGDSVAWTATYHAPAPASLGLASIDGRAVIGCGLLASLGYEYPSPRGGFAEAAGGACAGQEEAIDLGFTGRPTVLLLLPGAWEHSAVRSPDGTVLPARSAELAAVLHDRVLDLARRADAVGGRTVIIEWACPGPAADPARRDPAYIRWLNDHLADTAEDGRADGLVIDSVPPPPTVCVGGEATGAATDAKNVALEDEVHTRDPDGGAWMWRTWLLPAVAATRPG